VLHGFSTFTASDLRRAALRVLQVGPVRLKPAGGIGGFGQKVVRDEGGLQEALQQFDPDAVQEGMVVERNLSNARTFSIGRVKVAGLEAAYFGEQHTTRNRHGIEVYGGTTLTVQRGGFDTLRTATDDPLLQQAIAQADMYHRAALDCFSGMFASRCNYDLVLGDDAQGAQRMGVLEQSWRIGGASGAEIAALQTFADDPAVSRVQASTVEQHGADVALPHGAILYYQGLDPHVGPITKYALLHHHAVPRRND
jgi:hypothetical protein